MDALDEISPCFVLWRVFTHRFRYKIQHILQRLLWHKSSQTLPTSSHQTSVRFRLFFLCKQWEEPRESLLLDASLQLPKKDRNSFFIGLLDLCDFFRFPSFSPAEQSADIRLHFPRGFDVVENGMFLDTCLLKRQTREPFPRDEPCESRFVLGGKSTWNRGREGTLGGRFGGFWREDFPGG